MDEQVEHAGFLMALGLNGHLKDLMDLTIFMYLVKSHEMTRVGLMLGIAVSKRGTIVVSYLTLLGTVKSILWRRILNLLDRNNA